VIALDTNVLVYARREEAPHHRAARALLVDLAEGEKPWALLWPCVYEFVRVVTHPRVFAPPSPLEAVLTDLEALFASPSLHLVGEGTRHAGHFRRMVEEGDARGNLAHDAHIAALVLEHGISELLSADRDFARFPGIRVRDPFRAS
jgi:uncharacterized protein